MKLDEILHENKWDYPKDMKGKDKPNSGGDNRKQRKAFRKKQKAAAHKERMRGGSGAD